MRVAEVVGDGSAADFDIALDGGSFADDLTTSDLTITGGRVVPETDPPSNCAAAANVSVNTAGGVITLSVSDTEDWCAGTRLRIVLPDMMVGFTDFMPASAEMMTPEVPRQVTATVTVRPNAVRIGPDDGFSAGMHKTGALLQTMPAYTATIEAPPAANSATKATVDLEDPTKLANGTADDDNPNGFLFLAKLEVSSNAAVQGLDLTMPEAGMVGLADGMAHVTVTSSTGFRPGDAVVALQGATSTPGESEGNTATILVPLPAVGFESDPMLGRGAGIWSIRFVPGGMETIPQMTTLTAAGHSLSFASDDHGGAATGMNMATVMYNGIDSQAYAYAIAPPGQMDESNVRVTCTSATACLVYADCREQGGDDAGFAQLGSVSGGETARWTGEDIAAVLPGGNGGWTQGRRTCTLLASGMIEVQHLMRRGDILSNLSVVINKPIYQEHSQ